MSEHENPLSELERQLQALRPAAALDRDAVLFRAGQASMQRGQAARSRWGMLLGTNVATALAASLLVMLTVQREPDAGTQVVERAPEVPSPQTAEVVATVPARSTYVALRNQALSGRWEEEAIASAENSRESEPTPASYRQLLEQFSEELR